MSSGQTEEVWKTEYLSVFIGNDFSLWLTNQWLSVAIFHEFCLNYKKTLREDTNPVMRNPQQRNGNEYPCMKEGSIKIVLILKTVYNLWPKHWQRVKENVILLFQTSLRWTPACTGLDCWAVCQCWISKGNDGLKVQHVMQRKAHSDPHWKPFGGWKKFLSFFGNMAP